MYYTQIHDTTETEYLAKGHKQVGESKAQTHSLMIWSPALYRWTTLALNRVHELN